LAFLSISDSIAQQKVERRDFIKIKTPGGAVGTDSLIPVKKTRPNPTQITIQETLDVEEDADLEGEEEGFDVTRDGTILREDTLNPRYETGSIVEVNEEVLLDSTWVQIAGYYAVWDSRKVNPYGLDPLRRKDTVGIQLFDPRIQYMGWSMPGEGLYPTSRFGPRRYRYHYGIDLRVHVGDSIRAAFGGIVRMVHFDKRGYGRYVLVRHYNGLETLYGHLSKQLVSVGQYIAPGEVVGLGGSTGRSTGPHLHFEVRYEGNPLNPELLYDFEQGTILTDFFELSPEHYEYIREMRRAVYHKVRPGDTLGAIARKYGVRISHITRLNGISNRTLLRVGRRLRIR
jgi:murein DD-endopeptidase MepM/ murein hydrolase activator NlpD